MTEQQGIAEDHAEHRDHDADPPLGDRVVDVDVVIGQARVRACCRTALPATPLRSGRDRSGSDRGRGGRGTVTRRPAVAVAGARPRSRRPRRAPRHASASGWSDPGSGRTASAAPASVSSGGTGSGPGSLLIDYLHRKANCAALLTRCAIRMKPASRPCVIPSIPARCASQRACQSLHVVAPTTHRRRASVPSRRWCAPTGRELLPRRDWPGPPRDRWARVVAPGPHGSWTLTRTISTALPAATTAQTAMMTATRRADSGLTGPRA